MIIKTLPTNNPKTASCGLFLSKEKSMPGSSTELNDLKLSLIANNQMLFDKGKDYQDLKIETTQAYDDYVGATRGTQRRADLEKIYEGLEEKKGKALLAIEFIQDKIEIIQGQIDELESPTGNSNSQLDQKSQNPVIPEMRETGFVNTSGEQIVSTMRILPTGKLQQGYDPGLTSLIAKQDTLQPRPIAPVVAPVVPTYEAPQTTAMPPAQYTLPTSSTGKPQLPPLVRLDGQPLVLSEKIYPAMAYKENEHEVWPDEAIALATQKYPELPKQIADSQTMVPDRPEDLDDPDYYPMPENPRFKDLFYNGVWKDKKSRQT
jgi:hypothetical protein